MTNLNLNIFKDFGKIYTNSRSLCQFLYQKIIKCFCNYIPSNKIPNFRNEEDLGLIIDEIVNDKGFEKSGTEKETNPSKKEIQCPQKYDSDNLIVIFLKDLNDKELNNPRVQAMNNRSRRNYISIFIVSQENYHLPKDTIRANGNVYHIFEPNIFTDVPNLYQDKAGLDMTRNDDKFLNSFCWSERYQTLTFDVIKKFTDRCRLGL